MDLKDIEQVLDVSYQDFKLSKTEKHAFHQLFESIQSDPDKLNFVRNRAFDMVADNYRYKQDNYIESLKWLEELIKTIDLVQNKAEITNNQAYFSPGTACVKKIIHLIEHAKRTIDVCVFTISDDNISRALLAAHKRKVKVRIVSDNDKADDRGSDIYHMAKKGIPIRVDRSANHMHHKYAIFDGKRLVNGSFNWTRSATKYNQENIVVSNDGKLIKDFGVTFEKLWEHCAGI